MVGTQAYILPDVEDGCAVEVTHEPAGHKYVAVAGE
jgi:hypothetical protein